MISIQPDSSIISSIAILREKKQFINKINFAFSCILQSLRVTNPRYDDNMTYLINQNVHKDLATALNNYEEEQACQQILIILVKLLSFNNKLGPNILETNIMKGITKNINNIIKNTELLVAFFNKVAISESSFNWYSERDAILSKLIVLKMSDINIRNILRYIESQNQIQLGKAEFFLALTHNKNKKIIKSLIYQIYKRIDVKVDRLSNVEMDELLKLVDLYIGDCQLGYIIYFILSKFYSFKQAVAANPSHKLIIADVYALGEANMQFQPAFTDQKSFIYTLAILSQGDRFSECYIKVLMPKFELIKSEAAQLKFLTELKKIGLKEDIKQLYNPLKQTLLKSKNPRLIKQYQFLLKNLDKKHQISKSKDTVIIDDSIFQSQKQFTDYFTSLLMMTTLFEANLQTSETQKFLQQGLKFCKIDRGLSSEYLPFLYLLLVKLESQFTKNQLYQDFLIDVYIQALQNEFKPNKISKLQQIIIRSFAATASSLSKQKDSVKLGVIVTNLVTNPSSYKVAVNKLTALTVALRNGEFKINTKLHLLFRLFKSPEYCSQIEDVVAYFLESIIQVLQKDQDSNKIVVLEGISKWILKLQKNHIFVKLTANRTVQFLLERIFYILVSLIRNLQCDALFEIIFELEQWIPLQQLLRKNQADKVISISLQNYSPHTADIIELCEIVFGEPESEYFNKSSTIREQIHKNIRKNIDKYTLQDLAAYDSSLELFSGVSRKTKFQIKNHKPTFKQLEERCGQFKSYVFYHDNPSEDPVISNVILQSLQDIVELSSNSHTKIDSALDSCARSLLVSLMWTFQNSEKDIPNPIMEQLNSLLSSSCFSHMFIRKALQGIAQLPHTFNLTKIPFQKLYSKYADSVQIIEVLNDLIKIIADSSPKALNNLKFQPFIEENLYFLVFEKDSPLIESKLKLIETVCLTQSNLNEFLLSKVFVLQKIIKADLSNPTFYRPKIIEAVLNIMDLLGLLKTQCFQLCKLFQKYIDESEICYMILLNLKQIPAEEITKNLNQKSLAYILINSEDKDLLEMSNKLMAEYKDTESEKQEEFLEAFTKKNYDKCEQLINQIEKPHEVQFIKNEVNEFLKTEHIEQFPKVKQFIMTNKKAEPVLYECEAFYKDEALLNDLVQKFEVIDVQLQLFSIQKGTVISNKPSLDLNIQSIKQMLKKQNFIDKYIDSILKGNQAQQLPKVKLICLLSKIPQLTDICQTDKIKKLFQNPVYHTLFYNSGLALQLSHSNEANILSLINHLQAHLIRSDAGQSSENQYICKLLKEILNHKPKTKEYFVKLMEIIPACRSINNTNNIDILVNMSHELLLLLHDHRKGFKFSTNKEETYFNNLELILIDYYQTSMTFSDLHNVSLKTMDRLFATCSTAFQYELFVYILNKYLLNEAKEKNIQQVIKRYPMHDKAAQFTEFGRMTYEQMIKPTEELAQLVHDMLKKFKSGVVDDMTNKQQTVETLKEYAKYMDLIIEKKEIPKQNKISTIEDHLLTVCGNTFYYNKIVKQKLVEKLIALYYIKPNNVVHVLLRLSHNKMSQILKSDVVVKFIKDVLKQILQSKPQTSDNLQKIMTLFSNSSYHTFETFFKAGLYSTIIEILKVRVMEKQILNFINGCKMDEKLVNQLYQRGLIQFSIQKIGGSPKDEGEEWITLLGRICINPAIQNKLLGIKIHEEVFKKIKDSKKVSMIQACAIFFTNLAFNNEVTVKWILEKGILKLYPKDEVPEGLIVEIVKNIYSVGYNNSAAKKYLIQINAKQQLFSYYSIWLKGMKSNYLIPWNICKAFSTLVLDPQFAESFSSDSKFQLMVKQRIQVNSEEECFNSIQFLHNLLTNINKPKLYHSLKSNKLHEFYQQLRDQQMNFSLKHVQMLIITTCLLIKWELLDSKQIKVEYFEYIFKLIIKHNISDQITKTALSKFLECMSTSKDVKVSPQILVSLETIARNRKSDIFMQVIVDIVRNIKDMDLIRSILTKGDLPAIICNAYSSIPKLPELQTQYMQCLIVMANSHVLADVIICNFGKVLLEVPVESMRLRVLDVLSQYTSAAQYIIELNGLVIFQQMLKKQPLSDQVSLILNIVKKCFRVKQVNSSQKQQWTETLNLLKLDSKSSDSAKQIRSLFNNKVTKLTPEIKQQLNKGVLCTLYKTDGSASKLLVVITKSLNQINCIHEGSSTVKPKWRVPINDIKEIVSYNEQSKFQKSHFYKSNFLGKKPEPDRCLSIIANNNELHILFPSKESKSKWVSSLMIVQQHVSQMLLMLR